MAYGLPTAIRHTHVLQSVKHLADASLRVETKYKKFSLSLSRFLKLYGCEMFSFFFFLDQRSGPTSVRSTHSQKPPRRWRVSARTTAAARRAQPLWFACTLYNSLSLSQTHKT